MSEFEPNGIYPAVPTAISEDGSINYDAQQNHTDYLQQNNVDGIVYAGCTGHAAALDFDEHVEFISEMADYADVPVIAGDGINSTEQTIDLANAIENEADIDAHLMISPYQNCPPQDLIVEHYGQIAEQVDEPMIAYNVPGRTGRNIEPETAEQLAQIDGIIGLKEASNDPSQIRELGSRLEDYEDFQLGSGDDPRNPLVYEEGGTFSISVSANVAPEESVRIWEEAMDENYQEAKDMNEDLMDLHNAMFQPGEKNPISVQHAVGLLGYEFGTPRMPLDRPPRQDEEYQNQEEIEEVMQEVGLIE